MARHIKSPTEITAAGNIPKLIREFVGRVNTGDESVSIAHMKSPAGWSEPGQRPRFDEFTVVLKGTLMVETEDGNQIEVSSGEAVTVKGGEWVKYSSPGRDGAEYIAVCLPAFSPDAVNRDEPDES